MDDQRAEAIKTILKLMRANNISRVADALAGYRQPQAWFLESLDGKEFEYPIVIMDN